MQNNNAAAIPRGKLVWTNDKELALLEVVISEKPYNEKHGSKMKSWNDVSANLATQPCFRSVQTIRGLACQEKFEMLVSKRRAQVKQQLTSTGNDDIEDSDVEKLLDEIIEDIDDKKELSQTKQLQMTKQDELVESASKKVRVTII